MTMDDRKETRRRRALSRWIKRGLLAAVALGLLALLVKAMLPKPVPVDLAVAEKAPLRVTVDEDGTTRVKDRYVVSAPLTGSLARLELDPGDSVKQPMIGRKGSEKIPQTNDVFPI